MDYIAAGLDPKKVTIFQQSQVSEHTELAWIFSTITTMPYLMRAHAFKDAEAKNKDITAGTFNYPMLMAADILLYDPEIVPVGQDQKQHIEITRDTAMKFNSTYGEVFKLPEGYIIESVATVPGVDGRKMSKSYNNTIPLFAERDEIEKAVMGIVTDSGGDIPTNVYEIHKLFRSEDDLKSIYSEHKGKYKALKDILVEDIESFIKPMREKRRELENNPDLVISIINEGSKNAKDIASQKMAQIRAAVGVTLD
jgi:tryptophanyl-tRNA synthetase